MGDAGHAHRKKAVPRGASSARDRAESRAASQQSLNHQRAGVGAGRAARTESAPSLAGVALAAAVGASLVVVAAAAMPPPQQLGVDTITLRLTTV